MSAKKVNKIAKELFIYVFFLFLILLTSINIAGYLTPKTPKVLGTETENKEAEFWQGFLARNPDYIPGWIEIGKTDKAQEIDPNYIRP